MPDLLVIALLIIGPVGIWLLTKYVFQKPADPRDGR